MPRTWQLQEAKNKLSEVIDKALSEGPQIITRRGVATAVLLSIKHFRSRGKAATSLVGFFARSPLRGVKLHLERDRDTGRRLDLDLPD